MNTGEQDYAVHAVEEGPNPWTPVMLLEASLLGPIRTRLSCTKITLRAGHQVTMVQTIKNYENLTIESYIKPSRLVNLDAHRSAHHVGADVRWINVRAQAHEGGAFGL